MFSALLYGDRRYVIGHIMGLILAALSIETILIRIRAAFGLG